jgi:6-phosphogluconolactonase
MSEYAIRVERDPEACVEAAAGIIAASLAEAVAARGRADWATTGGSNPVGIYGHLSATPLVETIPWAGIDVWWGDDRFVPRDHPESNVKPFDDIMLATDTGVQIPLDQVHPFPTGEAIGRGLGADWCARTLADSLRHAATADPDGWPVFDLMLLGIGGDGHLLSVFPGSIAFDAKDLGLAIPAPTHIEPHIERVTLNPRVVEVARELLIVVHGADKAPVLARIFGSDRDPRRWPAQLAQRPGATWIIDEAAAAGIPR